MAKPVAGVEIGLVDGVLTVNPTKAEMANSTLQLTVAGTKEGILMIEGAANFLPEEVMVEALKLGERQLSDTITHQCCMLWPDVPQHVNK